jgi:hypothetical protein
MAPAGGAAVGQDVADGVAARDPGDPAAAVRGGPGLVEAVHRGAEVGVPRGGAGVEHLAQAQLAVEDVAADEAVLPLHLVRGDDLPVQHGTGEAGRYGLQPRDHPVGVGGQRRLVRVVGVGVWHPLGEQRRDMVPGRGQ